jgi:MoxR-like ATPase
MILAKVDRELIRHNIIGLENEVEITLLALSQGIPVMLEGETWTGKTELAKTVAAAQSRPFHRVDGNQELTAIKLHGWFDPPLVLEKGYNWDTFITGPLVLAMGIDVVETARRAGLFIQFPAPKEFMLNCLLLVD